MTEEESKRNQALVLANAKMDLSEMKLLIQSFQLSSEYPRCTVSLLVLTKIILCWVRDSAITSCSIHCATDSALIDKYLNENWERMKKYSILWAHRLIRWEQPSSDRIMLLQLLKQKFERNTQILIQGVYISLHACLFVGVLAFYVSVSMEVLLSTLAMVCLTLILSLQPKPCPRN